MPRADFTRDWPLTTKAGHDVPGLPEECDRLQRLESAMHELASATRAWAYEYGRVLKAMHGYEWERGEPAESPDALLAAEAAYYAALAKVAAVAGPAVVTAP
jgi:hypothetical protein